MTGPTSHSSWWPRSEAPLARRARTYSIALAAATLLATALAGGAPGENEPVGAFAKNDASGDALALMTDLSRGLERIERALAEADAGAVDAAGRSLLTVVDGAVPRLGEREVDAAELARHFSRLSDTLFEVSELAAESNLGGAAQALREARSTCVSCHVSFRSGNEERGLFPARENVVSGEVRLLDVDGRAPEDRSSVLVFLERDGPDPEYTHLRKRPVLDQRDRSFVPRVLPVVKGTTVDFPNGDTIFHNIFSLSRTKPFDLGIYEPGDARSVSMDDTGLVRVFCNIHPEMRASIVVLGNPHFALTDTEGRFVISDVPDGRWTLRAWNDLGADARLEIELSGGEWRVASMDASETTRLLPHKNKFGKSYDRKYR